MTSRLRLPLAALCAAAALAAVPAARAQTVIIGPGAGSLSTIPGGTFTVPVVADLTGAGGASLGSVTARLLWRHGAVRFISASAGTSGNPALNPDTAGGELRFAIANPAGISGTSVLVNAVFQNLSPAGDTMTFRLMVDEASRAGTFADLLPITVGTTARFCVSTGRYGDIDGNDAVTSFDALLIVTNAVGLPIVPFTVANGDTDTDGLVNTRDALAVLSNVVALPTPGFRVGMLNTGTCTVRSVTSVAVAPGAVTLAPGDLLPLTATLRDSVNQVVGGQPVSWLTRNAAVATVDSAGRVTAIGLGTTRIVGVAGPGVMDSATVTVGGQRHTWFVNPAIAAGNAIELGSPVFPFSTIQQAVDAAGAHDTVRVAATNYTAGARINKALHLLGDSTAFGFPRVRNAAGAAIRIDSVVDTVSVSRFHLVQSASGLEASYTAVVLLDRVSVESATGPGMRFQVVGLADLTDVAVNGAAGVGIGSDTLALLRGMRVLVDAISGNTPGHPFGRTFDVQRSGVVLLDSLTANGGFASFDVVGLRIRNADVGENVGGGVISVLADSVIVLDSVDLHTAEGDALLGGYAAWLAAPVVTATSVGLHQVNGGLFVRADSAALRGVMVNMVNGSGPALAADSLTSIGIAHGSFSGGRVELVAQCLCASSARVDSSAFAEAPLSVSGFATLGARGGSYAGADSNLVNVQGTTTVELVGLDLSGARGVAGPLAAVFINTADSIRADTLHVHDNNVGGLLVLARATVVRGSRFVNNNLTDAASSPRSPLYVIGQTVTVADDSIDTRGSLSGNSVAGAQLFAGAVTATGNRMWCRAGEDASAGVFAILSGTAAPWTLTGNTITGCAYGILAQGSAAAAVATARDNVIATDSLTGLSGLALMGNFASTVVNNDISGTMGIGGIFVWHTTCCISPRVDSNTVHDGAGIGIRVGYATTGALVRGNVVSDIRTVSGSGSGLDFSASGGGGTVADNRFERNGVRGVVIQLASDTVFFDRNVIVDDSADAMVINGAILRGRGNFFARNAGGGLSGSGTVVIDSSVFQQNGAYGAWGTPTWDLTNNYWGSATGPSCVSVCPGAGDSVVNLTSIQYTPFLSAPPSTPTGAPPAGVAPALVQPRATTRARGAAIR